MKKIIKSPWFFMVILFLFMLVFNFMTPYLVDDYQLMFHSNGEKIQSLSGVFQELWYMYFHWGGRVFAHFFTHIFLILPKWIFNVVNSIVYVLIVRLVQMISFSKDERKSYDLWLIHCVIFLCFPVVGQVFFWLDGSCNYAFTLLVQLIFLYLIMSLSDTSSRKERILCIVFGLLAGVCNENSSLGILIFLLVYSFLHRESLKIKVISFFSCLAGYLFLFLAPGNYVRINSVGGVAFFGSFFPKLWFLLRISFPILIFVLILVAVLWKKKPQKFQFCLPFLVASFVSYFSMIAAPQLSFRSFTFPIFCLMILFFVFLRTILSSNVSKYFLLAFTVFFFFVMIPTSKEFVNFYHFFQERDTFLTQSKKDFEDEVSIPIYPSGGNCRIPISCGWADLEEDADAFPNNYIEEYYGISKISGYHSSHLKEKK